MCKGNYGLGNGYDVFLGRGWLGLDHLYLDGCSIIKYKDLYMLLINLIYMIILHLSKRGTPTQKI